MSNSKTLLDFANYLEVDPSEIIEKYHTKIIKFWMFLDTLTEDQWNIIKEKPSQITLSQLKDNKNFNYVAYLMRHSYFNLKSSKAKNYKYISQWCIFTIRIPASLATLELIGDIQNPLYLPLFENL